MAMSRNYEIRKKPYASRGTKWLLVDLGRTMVGKVPGMYEYVQNYAGRHFPKGRADVLAEIAGKRETNPELVTQDVFSDFCKIWVEGYHSHDWKVDARDFIFPETVPYISEQKEMGRKIGLLTSGSYAFNSILLDVKFDKPLVIRGTQYFGLPQLIDHYFLGEEWGDKQKPETFRKIFKYISCDLGKGIEAVIDDKVEVIQAAFDAIGLENWPLFYPPYEQQKLPELGVVYWQNNILSLVWMNRGGTEDPRIASLIGRFKKKAVQLKGANDHLKLQLKSAILNVRSFAEYAAHEKHSNEICESREFGEP